MSSRELIDSLRRSCDENIRRVREQAECDAAALQAAADEKMNALQAQYAGQLTAAEGPLAQQALAESEACVRECRLNAEKTLADSLYSIARFSLRRLRDPAYPAVFEKIAKELPPLDWKLVRVHTDDVALAGKYFPDAEIVPVAHIAGGVDASLEDGSVRVINTFEKRLERAWDELLPLLIQDVYREMFDGSSPTAS